MATWDEVPKGDRNSAYVEPFVAVALSVPEKFSVITKKLQKIKVVKKVFSETEHSARTIWNSVAKFIEFIRRYRRKYCKASKDYCIETYSNPHICRILYWVLK